MESWAWATVLLSGRNPKLIMTSITPFGQSGPYKDHKGSDITILAMSGLMSINGDNNNRLFGCASISPTILPVPRLRQERSSPFRPVPCPGGDSASMSPYTKSPCGPITASPSGGNGKKRSPRMGNRFAGAAWVTGNYGPAKMAT